MPPKSSKNKAASASASSSSSANAHASSYSSKSAALSSLSELKVPLNADYSAARDYGSSTSVAIIADGNADAVGDAQQGAATPMVIVEAQKALEQEGPQSMYVYLSFMALGGAMIFPFKAVSNVGDFFAQEWPGTDILFYAPSALTVATPLMQSFTVRLFGSFSYTSLLIVPLLLVAADVAFLPFVPAIMPDPDSSFALALIVFAFKGVFGAVCQATLFSLAAALPAHYVQGVMEGQGWSGLLAVAIRAVIKGLLPDPEAPETIRRSGRVFFVVAALVVVAAALNVLRLRTHPVVEHYAALADKHPDVPGSLLASDCARGRAARSARAAELAGLSGLAGVSGLAALEGLEGDAYTVQRGALTVANADALAAAPGGGGKRRARVSVRGGIQDGRGAGAGSAHSSEADALTVSDFDGDHDGDGDNDGDSERQTVSASALVPHNKAGDHNSNNSSSTAVSSSTSSAASAVSAEPELAPVSAVALARAQWGMLLTTVLCFAATFLVFPGLTNAIKTPFPDSVPQGWYTLIINAVYFLFDLLGRAAAKRATGVTAANAKWFVLARYAVYPLFLALAYTKHFTHAFWGVLAVLYAAIGNGVMAARVFMVAPPLVAPRERPTMGGLMSIACVVGVMVGSLTAATIQHFMKNK